MDPDVKLYIKPGIFANQSKLYEYSSSYQGLHSEESLSLSYSQEEVEDNNSFSDKNISDNSLSHSSSFNEIK